MKKITVAVDGYSSCGKSTVAKALAKQVGYVYVDSGAMYRCVTLYCQQKNLISAEGVVEEVKLKSLLPQIKIEFVNNAETGKADTYLNGENVESEIRSLKVSTQVSIVAAIPFVREALVGMQQAMGKAKGVVMDGRDIGTTVFPDAELKLFMTASAEIRAQRRYLELKEKGQEEPYEAILENVKQRDYLDEHREVSPLRKAEDAIVLDNGELTPEQQNEIVLKLFMEKAEA
ncbi:MAG: (d)CMP kinase [Paludibacteraceae bacterium]|nr:(d)CMP kinase [Paludibacteraceae bacterium]